MTLEIVSIGRREERSKFIAGRLAPPIKGGVFDVGCDRAQLKRLVPGLD